MSHALNLPETILQALQRNQQALVIVPTPARNARSAVADLAELPAAEALDLRVRDTRGILEVSPYAGRGRARFLTEQQISLGAQRGLSVDLLLFANDKHLPELLPCLLVRRGLAVNYHTGEALGPAVTDAAPIPAG